MRIFSLSPVFFGSTLAKPGRNNPLRTFARRCDDSSVSTEVSDPYENTNCRRYSRRRNRSDRFEDECVAPRSRREKKDALLINIEYVVKNLCSSINKLLKDDMHTLHEELKKLVGARDTKLLDYLIMEFDELEREIGDLLTQKSKELTTGTETVFTIASDAINKSIPVVTKEAVTVVKTIFINLRANPTTIVDKINDLTSAGIEAQIVTVMDSMSSQSLDITKKALDDALIAEKALIASLFIEIKAAVLKYIKCLEKKLKVSGLIATEEGLKGLNELIQRFTCTLISNCESLILRDSRWVILFCSCINEKPLATEGLFKQLASLFLLPNHDPRSLRS